MQDKDLAANSVNINSKRMINNTEDTKLAKEEKKVSVSSSSSIWNEVELYLKADTILKSSHKLNKKDNQQKELKIEYENVLETHLKHEKNLQNQVLQLQKKLKDKDEKINNLNIKTTNLQQKVQNLMQQNNDLLQQNNILYQSKKILLKENLHEKTIHETQLLALNRLLTMSRKNFKSCDKIDWQKDSLYTSCQLCNIEFRMLNHRRHHCRCCGILTCDDCSSAYITYLNEIKPVRTCIKCVNIRHNLLKSFFPNDQSMTIFGKHHEAEVIKEPEAAGLGRTQKQQQEEEQQQKEEEQQQKEEEKEEEGLD